MRSISLLLAVVFFYTESFGQIIQVPTDRPTIQAAIDSAVTGDTVLVADGVYLENVKVIGKSMESSVLVQPSPVSNSMNFPPAIMPTHAGLRIGS